jgi:hypothetical protein
VILKPLLNLVEPSTNDTIEQNDLHPLRAGGFEGEYLDFFSAVRENRCTVSNFQNAWHSVAVAEAVQQGAGVET